MARGDRAATVRVLAGVAVLGLACLAAAQEPPSFKQGLWQFTRTVEGTGQPKSTMARKVCTSPTEDMRRGREQSAKVGCQLSDMQRAGNTYRYTATCVLQNGKITSNQILTVQGDSAYTVKIDSSGSVGGQTVTTKEELVAKRLGDCP
jgi:hypothetical protein